MLRNYSMLVLLSAAAVATIACDKSSDRCTSTNCSGCCDAQGQCYVGDGNAQCGVNASTCQVCAAAQVCRFGSCVSVQAQSDAGLPDAGSEIGQKTGRVSVVVMDTAFGATPAIATSASAVFFDGSSQSGCTSMLASGSCQAWSCPPLDAGTSAPSANAGSISITVGQTTVTLTPKANTYAPFFSSAYSLFEGGETVEFTASGGAVPAFSRTVIAPAKMDWATPALPSGALTIPRTQNLEVSWAGASQGTFVVSLLAMPPARQYVRCHFPVAPGHGSVPATVLDFLPAGSGLLAAQVVSATTVDAGGTAVELSAETVVDSSKGLVNGQPIVFQ